MEANEQLHEKDTEEENPDDVPLYDKKLYSKLYPHQRDGILFLFNAYKNGKGRAEEGRNGVILADEMGLGKSIQVIVFLHCMILNTCKFKNALLVVPAGLLSDWKDKLKNWTPEMNFFIYHSTEKTLHKKLRQFQTTGGILLVSYNMFMYHYKALTSYKGMPFIWDCLVFDEAHKLKNPASKTHKLASSISAGFYILMTGTPIQNNLKEYWAMFSLISNTYLLGTYKKFKINFENSIIKGMEADSGPKERALGMELQKALEKITDPFLLRRRKDKIQDPSDHTPSEDVLCLPKKNEYVVWIKLSPEQEAAYRNIVDDLPLLTFKSIHSLLAVCTHPRLNSDIIGLKANGVPLAESGKLSFMLALLEMLTANGNFVLVFSNYIKILDIIQDALKHTAWGKKAFLRIDGQNTQQRDKIVRRFQKKTSENILLLTTSVGAEGLTLTAADSVVFADISWNQSQDAQAVGRAHRIGQTKEVTTYRLITCGTLEETMYRRQLFKGALTRQSMGDEHNPLRHFTLEELTTMLTLQQTHLSYTQQQLMKQGARIFNITDIFRESISGVGVASVCGISDHGQLLSASQGENLEVDMARMHITETVQMCKQEIEAEFYVTRQPTGEDVSFHKCFKKGKIRKKTQKTRTPGLPIKYKCFRTPFSGTRRKTLHISRPCVFESSDESFSLPHIDHTVNVRSEATGDSACNSPFSKENKDTVEVSKGHQSTDLDTDMPSFRNSHLIEKDVSSVATSVNSSVYHEHISTPLFYRMEHTSDSEDSHCHKSSVSKTMDEHFCFTSPVNNNTEISATSQQLEAKNISVNTAIVSSVCKSVSDLSLVQPCDLSELQEESVPVTPLNLNASVPSPKLQNYMTKDEKGLAEANNISVNSRSMTETSLVQSNEADKFTDLKGDANSQMVKVTAQQELQNQMNEKFEESVPFLSLNLNTRSSENSPHSTNPGPSSVSQRKAAQSRASQELQESELSCEIFKMEIKSNKVVPVLCDYSLTPSCFSVCVTPSAEREKNLLRNEMADISYIDSYKSVLRPSHTATVQCDYSLRQGCFSLIDISSVEKEKPPLSGIFQSTPMQPGQVEQQESQSCLKTKLKFSPFHQRDKANKSTSVNSSPQEKLNESSLIKRSKKRTPGLSHKNKCFSPSLKKNDSLLPENNSDSNFKHVMFSHLAKFNDSTFSSTPKWKYAKENHNKLMPTMSGYSLNPSTFSQPSPETDKITQKQPEQKQLLIREDTDVKSTHQGTLTSQPDIMSSVNTVLSELSSTNAFVIKALRNLLIQKPQHKKRGQSSLCKLKRPKFSMSYRMHKKKLLNIIENVDKNQLIEEPQGRQQHSENIVSDAHVSLILSEHVHALVGRKSSSFSQSGSCPKLKKEMSSTEDQCTKPLIDILEGESVQPTHTVNVEYEESHCVLTDELSTPLNQIVQSSTTGFYSELQECSTANNIESTSHEDDNDIGLPSQDEFVSSSHMSSVLDCEMSNGSTPRKESHIINCDYSMHAEELEFTSKSYMDWYPITKSKDDFFDCVEEASSPVSNMQSPSKPVITVKEINEATGSSNASQFQNKINSASGVSETQPQAQNMMGNTEPPADGNKNMFRNEQNDTKIEEISNIQNNVEDGVNEMYRLLHNLKTL